MNGHDHRVAISQRFGARIRGGDAFFLQGAKGISALPCTVRDGQHRPLTGVNSFMLLQVMKDKGWSDPRFFTSHQVAEAGWEIAPGAKSIGLQYLVSTGGDGLALEAPEVKRFQVFNATEITGVPSSAVAPTLPTEYLAMASAQAGFEPGTKNLRSAVRGWLVELQEERGGVDAAGVALRVKLATALLEVQAGLPAESDPVSEFFSSWAEKLDTDPLSFFDCVKDAESLASTVMVAVKAIETERKTLDALQQLQKTRDQEKQIGGAAMDQQRNSARMEIMFAERTAVLAVPFADKDKAKAAGAMWYGPKMVWFVPKGLNLDRFNEWDPRSTSLGATAGEAMVIDSFRKAMDDLGLKQPKGDIIADGLWHNVSVVRAKKNTSGAYLLKLNGGKDGAPLGQINNKYSGESITWTYEGDLLTPEQKAHLRAVALEREAQAEKEEKATQETAATHAVEIFNVGEDPRGHGYVRKKGVSPEGLRQVLGSVLLRFPEYIGESGRSAIRANERYLLIPMTNAAGELRAIQAISQDGSIKSFMRGAQKKGLMFVLGAESFNALCADKTVAALSYVEGYATGASFSQASGLPVVVCFDAGNLEAVTQDTATKMPRSVTPIIAVDNDQFYLERALGMLSEELGVNPHAQGGRVVEVISSNVRSRMVSLGDAIADGEWHQTPKGSYCMTLTHEDDSTEVRKINLSIVPTGGRKLSMIYSNRGVEAGRVAEQAFLAANNQSKVAVVMPSFKSLQDRPTDWNDLVQRESVDAVQNLLTPIRNLMPAQEQRKSPGRAVESAHGVRSVGFAR